GAGDRLRVAHPQRVVVGAADDLHPPLADLDEHAGLPVDGLQPDGAGDRGAVERRAVLRVAVGGQLHPAVTGGAPGAGDAVEGAAGVVEPVQGGEAEPAVRGAQLLLALAVPCVPLLPERALGGGHALSFRFSGACGWRSPRWSRRVGPVYSVR